MNHRSWRHQVGWLLAGVALAVLPSAAAGDRHEGGNVSDATAVAFEVQMRMSGFIGQALSGELRRSAAFSGRTAALTEDNAVRGVGRRFLPRQGYAGTVSMQRAPVLGAGAENRDYHLNSLYQSARRNSGARDLEAAMSGLLQKATPPS